MGCNSNALEKALSKLRMCGNTVEKQTDYWAVYKNMTDRYGFLKICPDGTLLSNKEPFEKYVLTDKFLIVGSNLRAIEVHTKDSTKNLIDGYEDVAASTDINVFHIHQKFGNNDNVIVCAAKDCILVINYKGRVLRVECNPTVYDKGIYIESLPINRKYIISMNTISSRIIIFKVGYNLEQLEDTGDWVREYELLT